jgi:protein-disulfide isomerase
MMNDGPTRLAVPVTGADHIRGRKNAPVTLLEYGDFECPYCGLAYPVVKAVEARFGDVLRVVFRHFPLPQHPHAFVAAETAEFAGAEGRFWEMHDTLFEHQDALDPPHLLGYAQRLGLNPDALVAALEAGTYRPVVEAHIASGEASGVAGTPTFFVNGVKYVGDPTVEGLTLAVEALLAHAR